MHLFCLADDYPPRGPEQHNRMDIPAADSGVLPATFI